ncbi:hypothetical protein SAMN05444354_13268 [Stigmatella aurantiaca]|uniref:Uncharacterized protein n=1 Tax=Stigmatella aurantiaca TaxID=41 RepID=A0A1H8EC19_STIAU|nr:hypothetical protein SAMN05444354_13268 [Stigmatella aurantiaca]
MLGDARRAGSTPRRLALLCLLVLCCLITYGWDSEEARLDVRGSTFWPVPVAKTKARLNPFSDGGHTWVAESAGIYVVDGEGRRTHEPGSWLAPGSQILELIQTDRLGRAWAVTQSPHQAGAKAETQLVLVEAQRGQITGHTVLQAERISYLREQSLQSPYDVYPNAVLPQESGTHPSLWIVFSHLGSDVLGLVDSQGRLKPVISLDRLGIPSGTDTEFWQVVPLEGGQRAWLKTSTSLFFIDAQAAVPVRGPLLEVEEMLIVVPSPDGTHAWVMARPSPQPDDRRARRLYSVTATAEPGTQPIPLLNGEAVRQIIPDSGGSRLWVAGATRPETGGSGGLYLIDPQGRSLLPQGPLFLKQGVLVTVTSSGHVWVLTREGDAHVLDGTGRRIAGGKALLPLSEPGEGSFDRLITYPIGTRGELLVWTSGALHLQPEGGSIRVTSLTKGQGVRNLFVEANGKRFWFQSETDGNLYFAFLREDRYLETHLVLRATDLNYVFPAPNGENGWIQTSSASFAYVHRSHVGAALALQGGSLKIEQGRNASLQGTFNVRAPLRADEAGGITLNWPGLAHAAGTGGLLQVTLWDSHAPQSPAASVIRSFEPGAPSPRLNWYVTGPSLRERTYDIVFKYQDDFGTETRLTVQNVPFHAPLREQIWFRTAVACAVATLFLILPMVFLPPQRLTRRWGPFVSWLVNIIGGSGLALAGLARDLRIHFPAFVGVLFAEMLLCLAVGAFSPAMFRLLASAKPFQWLVPLALTVPTTRRRVFCGYVAHVRRKLETWRRQANDERFVSMPVSLRQGGGRPSFSKPEEQICRFLMQSHAAQSRSVLIESPGGRGKSALLREVVRRMLLAFEEDPSRPLPVLCEPRATSLESAAYRALEATPLTNELHEMLLQGGDCVLVVDGLTESSLIPEALQAFIDSRHGAFVKLLCTSRPHVGFRHAIENSAAWLHVEPNRMDEETLGRFISAYAPGSTGTRSQNILRACRGADGTYLPILVRLALLFGGDPGVRGIAELYEAAFRGLLRQQGAVTGEEDSQLLAWTSQLCLRTYWVHGIRSLRYRNAPEQEPLQRLLTAGVLVPDDTAPKPGQVPCEVRFFHDSMQSYLTACGLFAQEHAAPAWDILWRAAGDPLFSSSQPEAGSELFQMCLQVFGPREKLRKELQRQLLEWAQLYDDVLTKRHIFSAVAEPLQTRFRFRLASHTELSSGSVLRIATEVSSEDLPSLGTLYMNMAHLLWPLRQDAPSGSLHPPGLG